MNFPGRAARILPEVLQLTDKQGHAGFLCCREEQAVGTQGGVAHALPGLQEGQGVGTAMQNPSQAATSA